MITENDLLAYGGTATNTATSWADGAALVRPRVGGGLRPCARSTSPSAHHHLHEKRCAFMERKSWGYTIAIARDYRYSGTMEDE